MSFCREIHEIKYTGSGATMQAVIRAKDRIKNFRRDSSVITAGPGSLNTSVASQATTANEDDLPPPYSENPPENPYFSDDSSSFQVSSYLA